MACNCCTHVNWQNSKHTQEDILNIVSVHAITSQLRRLMVFMLAVILNFAVYNVTCPLPLSRVYTLLILTKYRVKVQKMKCVRCAHTH